MATLTQDISILYSYAAARIYTYISRAMLNGSHTIEVYAVDEMNNYSNVASGVIIIDTFLRPAQDVYGTLEDDDSVTLHWTLSPDDEDAEFAYYNVYTNGGSGDIDLSTPITQLVAGTSSYNTGVLAIGDHRFVVRVEKTDGKIEQNMNCYVRQILPDVPNAPGLPGSADDDTMLMVTPESNGRVIIGLLYPYQTADHFNIYWRVKDSGVAFSYGTPQEQFDRQNSIYQEHTTSRITSKENITYEFVVRAAYATGVEEENTNIIEAVLDGCSPQATGVLTLTAVFNAESGSVE